MKADAVVDLGIGIDTQLGAVICPLTEESSTNLVIVTLKLPHGCKVKPLPVLANGAMLDATFLVGVVMIDAVVEVRTLGASLSPFGGEAGGAFEVDLDPHCDEVGGHVDEGTILDDLAVEMKWCIM